MNVDILIGEKIFEDLMIRGCVNCKMKDIFFIDKIVRNYYWLIEFIISFFIILIVNLGFFSCN